MDDLRLMLNAPITLPLLLSSEEAANALSVSKDTIQNLHRTGQLRGVMVGKHLRWAPADLRLFVEQKRTENDNG